MSVDHYSKKRLLKACLCKWRENEDAEVHPSITVCLCQAYATRAVMEAEFVEPGQPSCVKRRVVPDVCVMHSSVS